MRLSIYHMYIYIFLNCFKESFRCTTKFFLNKLLSIKANERKYNKVNSVKAEIILI